jgi:hypothetical protein
MAERKINGRVFRTEPALAKRVVVLQAKLLKVIGPATSKLPTIVTAFGKDAEGKRSPEDEAKLQGAAVSALMDVFAQADPDEWGDLVAEVCEMAQVQTDGPSKVFDPVKFDDHFTGRLEDVVPVLAFVLREQLGGFFRGLLEGGNLARVKAAS